jgi:ribonuclease HII
MMLQLFLSLVSFCTSFTESFLVDHQFTPPIINRRNSNNDDIILCWARGKRRPHRSRNPNNSFRKIVSSSDDILAYEKSLIINRDNVSYVLGSDETGTGAICGPVITATCCILQLKDYVHSNNEENSDIHNQIVSFFTDNESNDDDDDDDDAHVRIKDSKQILPNERERIYQTIIDNPQMYAFAIAQRSNKEIDETNNIITTKIDCFTESIESLVQNQLIPLIERQQQQQQTNHDENHDSQLLSTTTTSSSFYSIVDGQKSPKLTMDIPCRPMVKADSRVVTVALSSIIAKVTRDRMAVEWHEQYPQYGFDHHKGYATRQHIEAIHR